MLVHRPRLYQFYNSDDWRYNTGDAFEDNIL